MAKIELFSGFEEAESCENYDCDNLEQTTHELEVKEYQSYGIPSCENVRKEYVEIYGDENSNEDLI